MRPGGCFGGTGAEAEALLAAEAAAADRALTAAIAFAADALAAAAFAVTLLCNPVGVKRIGKFTDSAWSCRLSSGVNGSIAMEAFVTTLCCCVCCVGGACTGCCCGGA